jgi:hypothetical protein
MSLILVNVGEIEMLKRMFSGWGCTLSNVTNSTSAVCTTTVNHPFNVNDRVTVSDVVGQTGANGTFVISAVTATTFTLTGTTAAGAYVSGGTVNLADQENLTLKLRNDAITPAATDVAGTYTESSFTGYVAKTLNSNYSIAAAWGTPTGGNPATIQYPQQTWSPTSSQTCNGYFIVGAKTGTLFWSENFASAKNLSNGDTLNLQPRITLT